MSKYNASDTIWVIDQANMVVVSYNVLFVGLKGKYIISDASESVAHEEDMYPTKLDALLALEDQLLKEIQHKKQCIWHVATKIMEEQKHNGQ